MSKSGIKEEKDFKFYMEVLIVAFMGFFAVYPVVLDFLEKRSKVLDAFIISVAFTLIMLILILLWSFYVSKKSANKRMYLYFFHKRPAETTAYNPEPRQSNIRSFLRIAIYRPAYTF